MMVMVIIQVTCGFMIGTDHPGASKAVILMVRPLLIILVFPFP